MARKKKKSRRISLDQQEYDRLNIAATSNVTAISTSPKVKRWTKYDIKQIEPMTLNQRYLFEDYHQGYNIVSEGYPGTGKTFLSMYLALSDIFDKETPQTSIKIIRSAVSTRDVGALPGSLEEKLEEYETPYVNICTELYGSPQTYKNMKQAGFITFDCTSYVRGCTWDNTIIIIDEAQNLTWHELYSVITRLGVNSRLLIAGDTKQCDLVKHREETGFDQLLKVTKLMETFSTITFNQDDCVRSDFVKSWLSACNKLGLI